MSFITIKITDKNGLVVPEANNLIEFSIEGPGEIIATDNGDPSNMVPFGSKERNAFNGFAIAIVRSIDGDRGTIRVTAKSNSLVKDVVEIKSK